MNLWIAMSGLLIGLALALLIRELVPAGPSLRAAVGRLDARSDAAAPPPSRSRELARNLSASVPWLPVPAADRRLLGQNTEDWLASKGHARALRVSRSAGPVRFAVTERPQPALEHPRSRLARGRACALLQK